MNWCAHEKDTTTIGQRNDTESGASIIYQSGLAQAVKEGDGEKLWGSSTIPSRQRNVSRGVAESPGSSSSSQRSNKILRAKITADGREIISGAYGWE